MSTKSTAKKILQSFHARTTLWKLFEIRAKEMECTIDYLINEAMRLYATQNGFLGDDPSPDAPPGREEAPTMSGATVPINPVAQPRPVPGIPRPGAPPPPSTSGPPTLPRPGGSGSSNAPRPVAPPTPAPGTPGPVTGSTATNLPRLTLIYQGSKIPINQEQFIIGRGSKASDLAIRDSNVSRKHAAIIYHNGAFYLKDLGSTNGIEYDGRQVDSKRIDEGDVFFICGHELHFTYQV